MERIFYTSAPQIARTDVIYLLWNETYPGGIKTFTDFMTTPSEEREAFLGSLSDRLTLRSVTDHITIPDIV